MNPHVPTPLRARTYDIRTYGCQMNVHDSERLAGLLETAGYERNAGDTVADLVVFNTCAVRENADNRLYGNLGNLSPAKAANPDMQIAVGGCLAQKDRGRIVERAPWGRRRVRHAQSGQPAGPARTRPAQQAGRGRDRRGAAEFPVRAAQSPRVGAQRVGVDLGRVRQHLPRSASSRACGGTETDRRPGDVLAEIRALVDSGVLEVTLLGQNVNSYGRSFGDRFAFGRLLRACGEIEGLERVRFTSPHPRDFTDDVIAAMAETPNVMPQLHMPMQSRVRRGPQGDAAQLPP